MQNLHLLRKGFRFRFRFILFCMYSFGTEKKEGQNPSLEILTFTANVLYLRYETRMAKI